MNPPPMLAVTTRARAITAHRELAPAAGSAGGGLSSSGGTPIGGLPSSTAAAPMALRIRLPTGRGRGRAAAAISWGFVGSARGFLDARR
jgi:hypothetical protein